MYVSVSNRNMKIHIEYLSNCPVHISTYFSLTSQVALLTLNSESLNSVSSVVSWSSEADNFLFFLSLFIFTNFLKVSRFNRDIPTHIRFDIKKISRSKIGTRLRIEPLMIRPLDCQIVI